MGDEERAGERGAERRSFLRRSGDQLRRGAGAVRDGASSAAGSVASGASSVAKTVSGGASAAVGSASALTHQALTAIAADPAADPECPSTIRERAASRAFEMLPIVGPTRAYADARAKFQLARQTGDESLLQEARAGCLYACAIMGIDILILAPGTVARGGAWVSRATHVHSAMRRVGSLPLFQFLARVNRLPGVNISPATFVSRTMMDSATRQILRASFAARVMDELLSVALPPDPQ